MHASVDAYLNNFESISSEDSGERGIMGVAALKLVDVIIKIGCGQKNSYAFHTRTNPPS